MTLSSLKIQTIINRTLLPITSVNKNKPLSNWGLLSAPVKQTSLFTLPPASKTFKSPLFHSTIPRPIYPQSLKQLYVKTSFNTFVSPLRSFKFVYRVSKPLYNGYIQSKGSDYEIRYLLPSQYKKPR